MPSVLSHESSATNDLLARVRAGDQQGLADLFARYRERLRRMLRLRLDRRLLGKVDLSEVLHQAFADACQGAAEYLKQPAMPVFLWLRFMTGQRLAALHRQHLGSDFEGAGQEVSLYRGALPAATSSALAAQLLGGLPPSAQPTGRAELQIRLQDALNTINLLDREILVLRHFEELSNNETALVLGIEKSVASNRYLQALKGLKNILNSIPAFFRQGRG
jgi:RNA polymerase sigma-70 factor (ECF subfamily)